MPDKTILIVDDHDEMRKSLHRWLEIVFPQCRILEAGSGEEAIGICRIEEPDVVLMDIGLPGLNGIETTKRILSVAPASQVVMVTIHDEKVFRTNAELAGAIAYIPKSALKTKLIPTLTHLLEKREMGNVIA